MAEIIRMPRLSDTMEEGNIVAWLKKEGEKVKAGDVLAEVETDKATMELESFFDGVLLYIGVPSGPVVVDGIIAIIGKEGEEFKHLLGEPKVSQDEKKPAGPTEVKIPQQASSIETTAEVVTINTKIEESPVIMETSNRVKASPLAKNLAADAGLPINQIQGSGDQGRIIKKDVENFLANKPQVQVAPVVPSQQYVAPVSTFVYGDVPVTQMRKTIARRLGESKFTAPHFYLTIEINMDNAVDSRTAINASAPVKISFNDFVIKASATALRKHPTINSSWFGDKITYHKDINIGVAVAVEEGLLVPVINYADACILAVGSIIKKPIVKNDQIVIGNMMRVTLSCDHRVVDGATAAQFLQTLKSMLENPVLMLV